MNQSKDSDFLCSWGEVEWLHDGHVLVFRGYDITAFEPLAEHDIAGCPFCAAQNVAAEKATILTDEVLEWGRTIHFVACGRCGTRGPWGSSESDALLSWNTLRSFG
jgi:hypothetical protein